MLKEHYEARKKPSCMPYALSQTFWIFVLDLVLDALGLHTARNSVLSSVFAPTNDSEHVWVYV